MSRSFTLSQRSERLWLLVILLVTFAGFYPSLFCDFTNWDDPKLIIWNPLIRHFDGDALVTMFTQTYWLNYQPLTLLTLALEHHFFGLNSFVVHLDNLLLHLINTILVYVFIRKLSDKPLVALIATAFWAFNPMRVESVSWAVERKDVLYTLFYLLALIHYVNYLKQGLKNKYLLFALGFFIISCFAKGMAVSLSLAIIALDYYYKRKITTKAIVEKVPFFALSMVFGLIAVFATATDGQDQVNAMYNLPERVSLASLGYLLYLKKFIFPFNLSNLYPYPVYGTGEFPYSFWLYPVAVTLLLGLVALTHRVTRVIVFGFAFFSVTIVMVLQLLATNTGFIADRYTYIPYIGLCFILAEGIYYLINKPLPALDDKLKNRLIFGTLAVGWIILAIGTNIRTRVWQNGETLWENAVATWPVSDKSHANLAATYAEQERYDDALFQIRLAQAKRPSFSQYYMEEALLHSSLKDFESANRSAQRALEINPSNATNLHKFGALMYHQKNYDEALKFLNLAVEKKPDDEINYYYRGNVWIKKGKQDSALADFNRALIIKPVYTECIHARGNTYQELGRFKEAMQDYKRALDVDPSFTPTYTAMALYYMNQVNDMDSACACLMKGKKLGNERSSEMHQKYCVEKTVKIKKQEPAEKVYYDNGKIMLETVREFRDGDSLTLLKRYNRAGWLEEEGVIENGVYAGKVRWFFETGRVGIEGYHQDKTPYGDWIEYYPGGAVKAKYSYQNGVKEGVYDFFYDMPGRLWTRRIYRGGKLWEVPVVLSFTGDTLEVGSFKSGSGVLNQYNANGKRVKQVLYKNGEVVNR
ncbi:tetratricopeptide repeat protein [bacterium SCSIO 12741]|nr:tetratricopeptide repeat protein [bacterium SCSIO 12741]